VPKPLGASGKVFGVFSLEVSNWLSSWVSLPRLRSAGNRESGVLGGCNLHRASGIYKLMAHQNIDARRAMVGKVLNAGIEVGPGEAKVLGVVFNCSMSAIVADCKLLCTWLLYYQSGSINQPVGVGVELTVSRDADGLTASAASTSGAAGAYRLPSPKSSKGLTKRSSSICGCC
jgi:hypothetical protein